jgi:hypothetical protein
VTCARHTTCDMRSWIGLDSKVDQDPKGQARGTMPKKRWRENLHKDVHQLSCAILCLGAMCSVEMPCHLQGRSWQKN